MNKMNLVNFWIGVLDGTIEIYPKYRAEVKENARTELRRMAREADQWKHKHRPTHAECQHCGGRHPLNTGHHPACPLLDDDIEGHKERAAHIDE